MSVLLWILSARMSMSASMYLPYLRIIFKFQQRHLQKKFVAFLHPCAWLAVVDQVPYSSIQIFHTKKELLK